MYASILRIRPPCISSFCIGPPVIVFINRLKGGCPFPSPACPETVPAIEPRLRPCGGSRSAQDPASRNLQNVRGRQEQHDPPVAAVDGHFRVLQ